ncbi:hypothetical protein JCM10908_000357 [Rhodotorula pacifica]|uniref:uncharacterized protein n=1 Tax=Rhodotorula pacifica TaxID=1495444 RepID=UPI003179B669
MRISPETRLTTIRHISSKLPLLLLLWLLSPAIVAPSRSAPDATSQAVVATRKTGSPAEDLFEGLISFYDAQRSADTDTDSLPQRGQLHDDARRTVPVTEHDEAAWRDETTQDPSGGSLLPATSESPGQLHHSRPPPDTRSASSASAAAPAESAPDSREASSLAPPTSPPSPRAASTTAHLTPLRYTFYFLFLLFTLLRPLLLTADEALSHALLANPLPPRLRPSGSCRSMSSFRSLLSFSRWTKRISLLRWRVTSTFRHCGPSLFVLLLLSTLLLAIPIGDCLTTAAAASPPDAEDTEEGWNVVAGRWILLLLGGGEIGIRKAAGFAGTKEGARGWKPLRNVVWLEILDTLACAAHGLLPILLHFRLLPSTLSGNFLLTPPSASRAPARSPPPPPHLRLPTSHLLSTFYLPLLSHSLTLSQILQLLLARSPITHPYFGGFMTATTVLIGLVMSLEGIAAERERTGREAERLRELGERFACATSTSMEKKGQGGAQRGRIAEEEEGEEREEWICSICLVASSSSSSATSPARRHADEKRRLVITFETPCRLPCAHIFHAHCLANWFSTVSACPTCHRVVQRPSPSPSPWPSSSAVPITPATSFPPTTSAAPATVLSASSQTSASSSPHEHTAPSTSSPAPSSASSSTPYFTLGAREHLRLQQQLLAQRQVDQYPGAAAASARRRRRPDVDVDGGIGGGDGDDDGRRRRTVRNLAELGGETE